MYYVAPIKKNGKDVYPKWFQCYKCDVKWLDIDNKCWYCGKSDRLTEGDPLESDNGVLAEGVPPIC